MSQRLFVARIARHNPMAKGPSQRDSSMPRTDADNLRRLYHFTGLIWLADILESGISMGEVPIRAKGSYGAMPRAVNLTSNPDRDAQYMWRFCDELIDKTRVRLTLMLPAEDVVSFKRVKDKYKMKASWVKDIAPGRAVYEWFYVFGTIAPESITCVEVYDNESKNYEVCEGQTLDELIKRISAARKDIEFGSVNGAPAIRRSTLGARADFLLDGPEGPSFFQGRKCSDDNRGPKDHH